MKRILFVLAVSAACCFGQSTTSITATNVLNAAGAALPNGKLCFVASTPLTPSGGSASVTTTCGVILNGSLTATLTVPNLATASPAGASYTIEVIDTTAGAGSFVLWIPGINTVTGSSFSFDTFQVPATITALGSGSPLVQCQTGAVYLQSNAASSSSRWSCVLGIWQNQNGQSSKPSGGSGINSLNGLVASTQTFVNDTNITITSSGTTHTLGFTGTLAKSRQNPTTVYTDQSNTYTSGTQDFTGAAVTKPVTTVTVQPTGSCTNAAAFVTFSNGTTGNLWECIGGAWSQIAGGGAGGSGITGLFGDVTTIGSSGSVQATLATVNVNTGICGDQTDICQVNLDAKGRVLSAAPVAISAITSLTGDVVASGPGAASAALATVNGSPVTNCGDATHSCQITVDAKGRTTAASAVAITGTGGGSSSWSAITNPTGSQTLSMGTNPTQWTWTTQTSPTSSEFSAVAAADSGTSTTPIFSFFDTTGNTRTGPLIDMHTVGTSTAIPFQTTAKGTANGVQLNASGAFRPIGTGTISATNVVDSNGLPALGTTASASAVDYVNVTNGATGAPGSVTLSSVGTDTNINLLLQAKGTGKVQLGSTSAFLDSAGNLTVVGCTGCVAGNGNATSIQGIPVSATAPSNTGTTPQGLIYDSIAADYVPGPLYTLQNGYGTNVPTATGNLQVNIAITPQSKTTTYTIQASDCGTLISLNTSSTGQSLAFPAGGGSFYVGCPVRIRNINTAAWSLVPAVTTSMIYVDGTSYSNASPYQLAQGHAWEIIWDGTNWLFSLGS